MRLVAGCDSSLGLHPHVVRGVLKKHVAARAHSRGSFHADVRANRRAQAGNSFPTSRRLHATRAQRVRARARGRHDNDELKNLLQTELQTDRLI